MTAPSVQLVKSSEFSAQFSYNQSTHKWSVGATSTDVGNLITAGADNLPKLSAAAVQGAQALPSISYDSVNQQFTFNNGLGQTTIVPLHAMDMTVTGASLSGTTLTLTESNGGPSVTVNLAAFLQAVTVANGNGIALSGAGTAASPLTATITLDPAAGNMLKLSATGLKLAQADVLALLNANTTVTLGLDTTNGNFNVTVNGVTAAQSIINVLDSGGTRIGSMFA